MNAPAPIAALLADGNVSAEFRKALTASDVLSTVQPTSHDPQALAEASASFERQMGLGTRYWIAGYMSHADAGNALAEMIERGEIDYRKDDPDIEKKHGLWFVTIEQVAK